MMRDQVLALSAQGKTQRAIAAELKTSPAKVNRILQKARQRPKAGDGKAQRAPAARKQRVGHTLALAQAQIRLLRTCGATVQNLLDVLDDEHPIGRRWTSADVKQLDSARFTGEELADVHAALEQWKRDCKL